MIATATGETTNGSRTLIRHRCGRAAGCRAAPASTTAMTTCGTEDSRKMLIVLTSDFRK